MTGHIKVEIQPISNGSTVSTVGMQLPGFNTPVVSPVTVVVKASNQQQQDILDFIALINRGTDTTNVSNALAALF